MLHDMDIRERHLLILAYLLVVCHITFVLTWSYVTILYDNTHSSLLNLKQKTNFHDKKELKSEYMNLTDKALGVTKNLLDVPSTYKNDSSHLIQPNISRQKEPSSTSCFRLVWDESEFVNLLIKPDYIRNKSEEMHAISNKCRRFITLQAPRGRLGNLMFEIASLIGIAYENDLIPLIQPSFPLLRAHFKLPNLIPLTLSNSAKLSGEQCCIFSDGMKNISKNVNVTMHGYFQSWKYFRNITPIIRKLFTMDRRHTFHPKMFLNKLSKPGYQNVCIHVRRGDVAEDRNPKRGYVVADTNYLYSAMELFSQKHTNVQFIVLSDDIKWCKENIKTNVTFSPFTWVGYDFALMTMCDHVIITTGTFGWWGAWLSGGTVVYFYRNPTPGSKMYSNFKREDYFPNDWIGLH